MYTSIRKLQNREAEMNLTLNLPTTTIVAPPSNAIKWQMGFNSAFKGLISYLESIFISTKNGH